MKRWPTKPLGELGELKGGGTPSRKIPDYFQGEIPWITGADVTDFYISKARNFITRKAIENSATTLLPKNTVLIVSRTGVGKIGIAGMPLCISQDLTGVICNEDVCPDYLARFLLAKSDVLMRAVQGATILGITRDFLKQVEVPVPPLAEQERIVKLLDEADELRKLRAQADRRTAEFIPALFHKMFGDPITNPKHWPNKALGEATTINPKLSREKLPPPDKEFSFVPMAVVDQVLGVVSPSETRRYSEVSKGYTPFQNGDVLFAKITPCMQNGKSAIAENLVGGLGFGSTEFHVLRPTEKVISEYIFWLIRRPVFRNHAEQNFTGTGGQQRVSTSFMENYPCPIPPLPLQKEFAQRVTEIRELEAGQAASRRRLEELFQSLLHRAFNGEL